MSMALKALGYGKNAAGSFVKVSSIAPDKTGDLLIFLGTKLKNMAASMKAMGEGISLNGTIDLMVANGTITAEEVEAYVNLHGVSVDIALKAVALQKIGDKVVAAANSVDAVNPAVTVTANNPAPAPVPKEVPVAANLVPVAPVASKDTTPVPTAGPTVIPVNTGSSSVATATAVNNNSGSVAVDNTVTKTAAANTATGNTADTQEEIPAHVLALELC